MNRQPVVLYMEDDPRSRKVMSLILRNSMGLSDVTILEDSGDFLTQVLSLDPQPDVIFLDIHMEPYNGFQMLEMLRQRSEFDHIPVVALTASVMNEEVEELRAAGFHSCLGKPIDVDTFPDALNRILDGETIWRILS